MHATRPDISFTVIRLSQFAARPLTDHWLALKRVLRYIKGTLDAKLTFGGSGIPHLVGYFDTAYAKECVWIQSVAKEMGHDILTQFNYMATIKEQMH